MRRRESRGRVQQARIQLIMAICLTREAAEEYAKGDPFVAGGMVSKWPFEEVLLNLQQVVGKTTIPQGPPQAEGSMPTREQFEQAIQQEVGESDFTLMFAMDYRHPGHRSPRELRGGDHGEDQNFISTDHFSMEKRKLFPESSPCLRIAP